jgi:hypothetical protein
MIKKREVEFWSAMEDDDSLCETDIDQVIQDVIDYNGRSELSSEIEVYGFAKRELEIQDGISLEYLIERLDDDYGNPHTGILITQKMKDAERVFHEAIKSEYKVWACDLVEKRTINIDQWCKDNNYRD